jgi:hypothetical protein
MSAGRLMWRVIKHSLLRWAEVVGNLGKSGAAAHVENITKFSTVSILSMTIREGNV